MYISIYICLSIYVSLCNCLCRPSSESCRETADRARRLRASFTLQVAYVCLCRPSSESAVYSTCYRLHRPPPESFADSTHLAALVLHRLKPKFTLHMYASVLHRLKPKFTLHMYASILHRLKPKFTLHMYAAILHRLKQTAW